MQEQPDDQYEESEKEEPVEAPAPKEEKVCKPVKTDLKEKVQCACGRWMSFHTYKYQHKCKAKSVDEMQACGSRTGSEPSSRTGTCGGTCGGTSGAGTGTSASASPKVETRESGGKRKARETGQTPTAGKGSENEKRDPTPTAGARRILCAAAPDEYISGDACQPRRASTTV